MVVSQRNSLLEGRNQSYLVLPTRRMVLASISMHCLRSWDSLKIPIIRHFCHVPRASDEKCFATSQEDKIKEVRSLGSCRHRKICMMLILQMRNTYSYRDLTFHLTLQEFYGCRDVLFSESFTGRYLPRAILAGTDTTSRRLVNAQKCPDLASRIVCQVRPVCSS